MSSAPDTATNANGKQQIQKKLLNYARDFALEKLNQTLDKKLVRRRGDDDDDNTENADDGDDITGRGVARRVMPNSISQHSRRSHRRPTAVPHIVVHHSHPDDEESSTAVDRRPRSQRRHTNRQLAQEPHRYSRAPQKGDGRGRRGDTVTTVAATAGDSSDVEDNQDDDDVRRDAGRADECDDDDDGDDDVTTELVRVRTIRHHHSNRQPSVEHQRRHSSSSRKSISGASSVWQPAAGGLIFVPSY